MATDRHAIDADAAERLIAGTAAEPASVAALLRAAAAPGRPEELTGESAAVAAFRAARAAPVRPVRPLIPRRSARPGLGVRLALIAAAAAVLGLGLATVTGVLPDVTGLIPSDNSSSTVDSTSSGGTRTPAPATTRAAGADPDAAATGASASPPASLTGLCHAYRAQVATNPGHALENPTFRALIAAAGGRDAVPAYCQALIGAAPEPSTAPGRPPASPSRGHSGVTAAR